MMWVLLVVAAACASPVSPESGLRVETRMSAPTVRPGDTVTVSVEVSNHGTTTQRIDVGGCPAPFVITRADGVVVGPAERFCSAISTQMEDLAPGESRTITASWAGDALAGGIELPPRQLPAGMYRVQARVMTSRGVIEGAPVEVRVVP